MKQPTKPENGDTIKTSIKLPRALWKAAHIRALDEGSDLQDLIGKAIELYLKTPQGVKR